jgi:hypothetical protein
MQRMMNSYVRDARECSVDVYGYSNMIIAALCVSHRLIVRFLI